MPRFLRRVITTVGYTHSWALDYAYVGSRQLTGLVQRGDARLYRGLKQSESRPPVVIIPGIYERWEFMKPVADLMANHGYQVHVIEGLGYNRGSVEAMADVVDEYIRQHALQGCIIVAHSKGGLIGKYLMARHEGRETIKGMAAISTPFAGSKYARLLPLPSLRVFIPKTALLASLAQNERINRNIVSIYPTFDPHIPEGSYLEGAKNIQVPTNGHFRILKHPHVHMQLMVGLAALSGV